MISFEQFQNFKNWKELEYFATFRGANRLDIKELKIKFEQWSVANYGKKESPQSGRGHRPETNDKDQKCASADLALLACAQDNDL